MEEEENDRQIKATGTEEEKEFQITKLNPRSRNTILLLGLAQFLSGLAFSIVAPFFPQEVNYRLNLTKLLDRQRSRSEDIEYL